MAKFTAGYAFAAATGLETGQHLEDLVEQAEPVVDLTDDSTLTVVGGQVIVKDDGVTNAKLANAPALSLKGNATNAEANPTDIEAGTDGHVLRRDGTALAFGQLTQLSVPAALFSLMGDDKVIQYGVSDQSSGTTGSTGTITVTFPTAFASAPFVLMGILLDEALNAGPTKIIHVSMVSGGITDSDFTYRWYNANPNSLAWSLWWVAIGTKVS